MKIDLDSVRLYEDHYQLIPLHRYDDVSKTKAGLKRQDGKRPLHTTWTTRPYKNSETLKIAAKSNYNVGLRLTAKDFVIDVDPRNGGDKGFADLGSDLKLNPDDWPSCTTGSGSKHYYLKKPADLLIVDTLKDYPGVEFKSKGRQVLAAGSIHPNGKHYVFDELSPSLKKIPPVPKNLLVLVSRPQRDSTNQGSGTYSQADIARALSGLDVTKFPDNDSWFRLMCACHFATSGEGRPEFIEWSTDDPKFKNDAEIIGRRWDSLHTKRDNAITTATLKKILSDHGVRRRLSSLATLGWSGLTAVTVGQSYSTHRAAFMTSI